MQGELKRKCAYCGKNFIITKKNINEAIYYGNKTYHSKCFVNMCEEKAESNRRNIREKWSDILSSINEIKRNSYNHINPILVKDEVFRFIQDNYNVTVVPTNVWHKLGNIYSGTFKGMSVGIPPEHLLDMWTRKKSELDKIANRNKTIGKKMTTEQRISYDLSVLINKYDGYLKWLEKQKILEADDKNIKQVQPTNIITNITNVKYDYTKINKQNNDNISSLVDDIFED